MKKNKMINKILSRQFISVSSISIVGFLTGVSYERYRLNNGIENSNDVYVLHAGEELKKVFYTSFNIF